MSHPLINNFYSANSFGLSQKSMSLLKTILLPYLGRIEKISVFGSRAMNTHKENSDLDLVFYGEITEAEKDRLHSIFYESLLPIKIDVIKYENILHPPLKKHIDEKSKILFDRKIKL